MVSATSECRVRTNVGTNVVDNKLRCEDKEKSGSPGTGTGSAAAAGTWKRVDPQFKAFVPKKFDPNDPVWEMRRINGAIGELEMKRDVLAASRFLVFDDRSSSGVDHLQHEARVNKELGEKKAALSSLMTQNPSLKADEPFPGPRLEELDALSHPRIATLRSEVEAFNGKVPPPSPKRAALEATLTRYRNAPGLNDTAPEKHHQEVTAREGLRELRELVQKNVSDPAAVAYIIARGPKGVREDLALLYANAVRGKR